MSSCFGQLLGAAPPPAKAQCLAVRPPLEAATGIVPAPAAVVGAVSAAAAEACAAATGVAPAAVPMAVAKSSYCKSCSAHPGSVTLAHLAWVGGREHGVLRTAARRAGCQNNLSS